MTETGQEHPIELPQVGCDQVGLRRFHHQMKMVQHQTIGLHLPAGFAASLAERFQKTPLILVVFENRFPSITPVHHMVDRARILDSKFSRHACRKYAGFPQKQGEILQ